MVKYLKDFSINKVCFIMASIIFISTFAVKTYSAVILPTTVASSSVESMITSYGNVEYDDGTEVAFYSSDLKTLAKAIDSLLPLVGVKARSISNDITP